MKIVLISPIDSVNKDRVAFAAGPRAPTALIPLARLSSSTQVGARGISEKQEGAKKQEQETDYDDDYDDEDYGDDGGGGDDGEDAGRGRSAPGKIFAPGGKLVSERLRSMTEDERVRTAQQERSAERERERRRRIENWIKRETEGKRKKDRDGEKNGRVRNKEGGCFASVTCRYSGLLVSASLSRRDLLLSFSLPSSPSSFLCPLLIRVIRYHRRWLRR